ncbi:MAG: hypothetical protein UH854_06890 [Clostridia bacterium]|nr:hypothetical protein [Clostridia bacterium]
MDLKTNFLDITNWLADNSGLIISVLILAVISAIGCAVITKARKGLVEDVVFATIFGLVFNVLGLLFVIFRKPVWNNLGWIPVVVAWFFIHGNIALAIILCVYAAIWAYTQHQLLERIKVVED